MFSLKWIHSSILKARTLKLGQPFLAMFIKEAFFYPYRKKNINQLVFHLALGN